MCKEAYRHDGMAMQVIKIVKTPKTIDFWVSDTFGSIEVRSCYNVIDIIIIILYDTIPYSIILKK